MSSLTDLCGGPAAVASTSQTHSVTTTVNEAGAGKVLVTVAGNSSPTSVAITDSHGNTYVLAREQLNAQHWIAQFYADVASLPSGTAITATATGGTITHWAMDAQYGVGLATGGPNQVGGGNQPAGGQPSLSLTPTVANTLTLTGFYVTGGETFSGSSGWTSEGYAADGTSHGIYLEAKALVAAAAITSAPLESDTLEPCTFVGVTWANSGSSAPTITPDHGSTGDEIAIAGSGFTTAYEVLFGSIAAAFVVNSDFSITAVAPIGVVDGTVTVVTLSGSQTSVDEFTVDPVIEPPGAGIDSLEPAIGEVGDLILINGTGFTGMTGVTINGVACTTTTFISDSEASCLIPVGATTGPLILTTPSGSATAPQDVVIDTPNPSPTIPRRQAATGVTNGAADMLTLTWPEATLDESLLVMALSIGGVQPSGVSVPDGWQLVYQSPNGTTCGFFVWIQEWAASESGDVDLSWAGGGYESAVGVLLEYTGAAAVNVIDLAGLPQADSTQLARCGGTQPVQDVGETLLGFVSSQGNQQQALNSTGWWEEVANPYDPSTPEAAYPSLGVYEYGGADPTVMPTVYTELAAPAGWVSAMISFRPLPAEATIPSYNVAVQWGGQNTGLFIIGESVLDGPDVLGSSFGEGPFDVLDAAHGPQSVTIQRGRQDASSSIQAATATVVARDSDGLYNPSNPDSPLAGQLRPNRPIQVSVTYGQDTFILYTGFLLSGYDNPAITAQQCTFQAQDAFSWLTATPIIASMGVTTTGAAIAAMLDAIDWPPAMAVLDTGDSIPGFSLDGTVQIIDAITNLLTAERGICYVDASGRIVYESRNAKYGRSPRGIVNNVMTGVLPGFDGSNLYNRAQAQRTGGANQVYYDEDSVFDQGWRDLPAIVSDYITSDAQALQLARFLVATNKDPKSPIWNLTLARGDDPGLVQQMLGYDIGDVVTISEARGGTVGDFVIEGIQHTIQGGALDHQVTWTLSQRRSGVFIIGRSTLDGGDVLSY